MARVKQLSDGLLHLGWDWFCLERELVRDDKVWPQDQGDHGG